MSVTPNYNWPLIEPTDFVTNLPADFEAFGDAVDLTVDTIETKLDVITTEGDLVVGDASGDPVRVAVGTAGQILASDGTTVEWITPASSGLTWTIRSQAGVLGFANVFFAGYFNNYWLISGRNTAFTAGKIAYSTDAITWTTVEPGGSEPIKKVIYSTVASLWIAVAEGGQLYTSPDLITWTSRTSGFSTAAINDITENGSIIVAVGNGRITSSTNGTSWTSRSTTYSPLRIIWSAAESLFVTANASTSASLGSARSANGTSWSGATTNNAIFDLTYVGGEFVGLGASQEGMYSLDGITWTALVDSNVGLALSADDRSLANYVTDEFLVLDTGSHIIWRYDGSTITNDRISIVTFDQIPVAITDDCSIATNGTDVLIVNKANIIITSF